jgi:chitinase
MKIRRIILEASIIGLFSLMLLSSNLKAANVMNNGINATFWCAWGGNTSYNIEGKQITSKPVEMDKIDASYNVIITAFIVTDAVGNYTLSLKDPGSKGDSTFSKDQIIQFIKKTKAQNRKVIVSMGGEHFHLNMKTQLDADNFITQIVNIVDEYGFEGIDLDLESNALGSIDPKVLGDAVMAVVNNYKTKGIDFWLTAAPEWCYITPYMYGSGQWASHSLQGNFYANLIKVIGVKNFTYIWPQLYNQGPKNGVGGPEKDEKGYSIKVTPEDDGMDKFINAIAWSVTTNEGYEANGSIGVFIPGNKLCVGIPAAEGAAGGALTYIASPADIQEAWRQMIDNDIRIAGFMNWSVDWDATNIKDGDLSPQYFHTPWATGIAVAKAINSMTMMEI